MREKAQFKFYFKSPDVMEGLYNQYNICEIDWIGEKKTMEMIEQHVAEFKGLLREVVYKGETIYKYIYENGSLIKQLNKYGKTINKSSKRIILL